MVTHMKTTIDIADALFLEARRVAERDRTTFRSLVEQGLRLALDSRKKAKKFRLKDGRVRGHGLQPGIDLANWEQIRTLIYEGRGG